MTYLAIRSKLIVDHEAFLPEMKLRRVLLIGVVMGLDVSQKAIKG